MADSSQINNIGEEIEIQEKDSDKKFIIGAIVALLVTPIIVLALLYNFNSDFREKADNIISSLPGPIGDAKRNELTDLERNDRINYLARYYLEIDQDSAVDKLYIIKKDDERLYRDIVSLMSTIHTTNTNNIITKIRNKDMQDTDLLVKSYDEAVGSVNEEIKNQANQIDQSELLLAKNQTRKKMQDRNFGDIYNEVSSDKIANILLYMDEIEQNYIFNKLNKTKEREVKDILENLKYQKDNLKSTADILNKKPVNDVIQYLDNNTDLNSNQLAEILDNMDITKAAKVAAGLTDKERINDALFQLTILEKLKENENGKAQDISELVDFISEYQLKIEELVQFYRKVDPVKAATIFQGMFDNNKDVSVLKLNDPTGVGEKLFKTTDRKIALDILGGMRPKDVSNIISNMTDQYAKDFTKYYSQPNRAIDADGELIADNTLNPLKNNEKISLEVSFNADNIDILGKDFQQRARDLANSFNTMNVEDLVKIVDKMIKGDEFSKRTIVGIVSAMGAQQRGALIDALPTGTGATLSSMMTTGNFEKTFDTSQYETLDKVSSELAKIYNEMDPIPLARMIKRTYDDAYDFEDTTTLNSLIRILEKVNADVLSSSLDLLNPDMSTEITNLIYKYKNTKEVNQ